MSLLHYTPAVLYVPAATRGKTAERINLTFRSRFFSEFRNAKKYAVAVAITQAAKDQRPGIMLASTGYINSSVEITTPGVHILCLCKHSVSDFLPIVVLT